MAKQETKRQLYTRLVMEQKKWIESCGGTRAGYVARYGSASEPEHYGNGGEAIYDADKARLDSLEFKLQQAR